MAIEFMDGFDHYVTTTWVGAKWDATSAMFGALGSLPGRYGGLAQQGITNGDGLRLSSTQLTAQATRTVGFAFKLGGGSITDNLPTPQLNGGYPFILVMDAATIQIMLGVDSDGSLWITRDPTGANVQLGQSAAGVILDQTWMYIEFKYTIHGSAGAYEVRINGTSVLSATGKNTKTSANASSNGLRIVPNWTAITGGWGYWNVDDVYVLNSTGTVNNTFLGECQVLATMPASDGSNSALTPNSGTTHFNRVNEADPDTTTYNSSATVGATDSYHFGTLSTPNPVVATQTVITARRDTAGARSVEGIVKSGATTAVGTAQVINTNYLMYRDIKEQDPNTSAAWTVSGINSAEFGVRVI